MLTLFIALVLQFSYAQEKTITGVVLDQDGLPLPGANVTVKGTTNGTQTDFDGYYSIDVSVGKVVVYSFIGQKTVEKTVGSQNVLNITLEQDAQALDEVIVTALGIEKKKDDDLSSSTTVNTEAVSRAAESGVIQSMAGKTSGLKITRNSGDPGAGAYIQIRGQNTINGNSNPLIILDGVPISNTSVGGEVDGVTQQSRLNDINSEDIESVTVLKGAAAAAVWGTGAANGVLIIKTKSGRTGVERRVDVNVKSSVIVDKINVEFDKQGKFGQGSNGVWNPFTGNSWGDKISDRLGGADQVTIGNERFESETGNVYYPITSKNSREVYNQTNRDQIFGTGFTFDNSVSVSFSGNNSNTFLSYSDWNQDGIIKGNSSYRRQTFRINNGVNLTDNITAKITVGYTRINASRIQQGSNLAGLYLGYLRTSPDFDNRDYIGTYYDENNIPSQYSHRGYRDYLGSSAPIYNNPGWTINEQENPNEVERFIISPQINWQLRDNLTLTARYGLDYYSDNRKTFFPVNSAADFAPGFYSESTIQEKTQNINVFLQSNYDVSDNFNFGWIVGTSLDRNEYSRLTGESRQFTNPEVGDLRLFGNAETINEKPENFKEETRKSGAYAVINAELFNQLFFEFSGRYERPSTIEKNIFYPSASIGWKFSELIKENNFFSFGKFRASYGEVGIEPDAYSTNTLYSPRGISSSWGDELTAGAYGNPFTRNFTLGNSDIKEERVKEFEVGGDFRFFKNAVTLGITYYDRVTEDAILKLDLPSPTGFSEVIANAAEITNKGLEVDLGVKLLTEGNFKWSMNANYSHNRNEVTDLSDVKSVFLAGFTGTSSRVVEGEAIGTLWGNKFLRDESNNYVLNEFGFPEVSGEEGVIGDPNPNWIGGIGTVFTYKGISLSAQFETSQGNDHWEGTKGVLNTFGISPETANETLATQDLTAANGSVIPAGTVFRGNIGDFGAGPVALDQSWYTTNGGGFGNQSETFISDASWTRLRELSLGYEFPKTMLDKVGFSNMSITLSGRNLFLWTDIEGFDPDLNLTGASLGRGLDYFTNPATQSYVFTLKFGF
ncbi:TonB-linked outer membrane protein, SusC/RagA family [Galbibacter orientalis DSM 19592]|uniref:TonB-linked outer membrane protein, SusC/RagA family n=2 Tax=Galbibacter TaxID=379068 RepID=I3C5R3_9FLAO|nr:TonB-linked outer membrane protein, SusC/RagA family [Galbibacter orientalis DSM 19592]